jgi:hypothetical protein
VVTEGRCLTTAWQRGDRGARRAKHGVAALLKIHAHCIDSQANATDKCIIDLLATLTSSPAKKGMTTASRHLERAGQWPRNRRMVGIPLPSVPSVHARPVRAPKAPEPGRMDT